MNKQSGETENNTGKDDIRVGLIGAGKEDKASSYLLVTDRVEIVTICDVERSAAEKAAKIVWIQAGKCHQFTRGKDSVSETLENEDLEL